MSLLDKYRESGMLEQYAMDALSPMEMKELGQLIAEHPELKAALNEIEESLEAYVLAHAVKPPSALKGRLLAQLSEDELPIIHEKSSIESWQKRCGDRQMPAETDNIHWIPLGEDQQKTTLLVWSRKGMPEEVHTQTIERFLVLEGSCDCVIAGELTSMEAGSYMEIPLHKKHYIRVTSARPLKVILQKSKAA